MTDGTYATSIPAAWRAAHLLHQALLLILAAVAFLFLTWDAPMYKALFSGLPAWVVPPGIIVSSRFLVPLLLPIIIGLPLLVGDQRALALLWLGVMAAGCVLGVIEVSRLNWAAFVSGVAFRIESGPVPFLRTLSGLVVLLAGLTLLAHQATMRTVQHLAERGVPLVQLRETRRDLLALERLLVLGLLGAGAVLTLVALVSMSATERAPEPEGGWLAPVLWTAAVLVVIVGAFALGLWRRLGPHGGRDPRA